MGEAGLLRGRRATTYVSPGGCAFCSENKDWLAAYGAIVCDAPMVTDQRIFSDIGPGVCTSTALELFRAFIGESRGFAPTGGTAHGRSPPSTMNQKRPHFSSNPIKMILTHIPPTPIIQG